MNYEIKLDVRYAATQGDLIWYCEKFTFENGVAVLEHAFGAAGIYLPHVWIAGPMVIVELSSPLTRMVRAA